MPDGRLFVVDFDNNGNQQGNPHPENHTTFFVDYRPQVYKQDFPEFRFRHLEIMTFSALQTFAASVLDESNSSTVEEVCDLDASVDQLRSRY